MAVAETITQEAETSSEPKYTYKSFELVFASFCSQYAQKVQGLVELPNHASLKQIDEHIRELGRIMGEEPSLPDSTGEIDIKDAILLSARYLAWNATMGAITQRYIDKIKQMKRVVEREDHHGYGGLGRRDLPRLKQEHAAMRVTLLAQNHALRDYFESRLAMSLGNDSPAEMHTLLSRVPVMSPENRDELVKGISLEIAAKRYLDSLVAMGELKAHVNYGNDEQDAHGGDLVVVSQNKTLFIDLKSSMPKRFMNYEYSSQHDFDRGYKEIKKSDGQDEVVVWAYHSHPVKANSFVLQDALLAHHLQHMAQSVHA